MEAPFGQYPEATEELREALRLQQPNVHATRQNAVIHSVKIVRAKFLDDLVFKPLGEPAVRVPNDIDDFDLSSTYIQSLIEDGMDPKDVLAIMREGEAPTPAPTTDTGGTDRIQRLTEQANAEVAFRKMTGVPSALRWQNSLNDTYGKAFINYLQAIKDEITKAIKAVVPDLEGAASYIEAANKNENDADTTKALLETAEQITNGVLNVMDVKEYCKIKEINMDMGFNNQAGVEISLPKLRALQGGDAKLKFIPRENDVLSITLRFPDGRLQTIFTGLITGVSFTKEYGNITVINVAAFGLSKLLVVNKMVTDRAVITQFEKGELAQTGLTPWSNYFANQTVDNIFQFLMTNEMAMRINQDTLSKEQTAFRIEAERTNLVSMEELVRTNINLLVNDTSKIDDRGAAMSRFLESAPQGYWGGGPSGAAVTSVLEIARKYAAFNEIGFIQNTEEEVERIKREWMTGATEKVGNNPHQIQYGALRLFKEEVGARLSELALRSKEMKDNQPKALSAVENSYEMGFSGDAFTSSALFQMTYLPLVNLFLWRLLNPETPVAKFRGKKAVAYDLSLRSAFNLFFSQLQSPATVLNSLKSTAKYAVYENEDGQIVAELPRYNEFLADENAGENISDFILSNPIGRVEVVRQDLDLITRLDSKQYVPMVDYLPYTMSSRQFTDIAVMSKYGMRTDAPIYNPNAISSETASLYAALEVTLQNANTRTISMQHPADRKFKLGRLYFVAVGDLDATGGGPTSTPTPNATPEPVDGYVGFLNSFSLGVERGGIMTYNLNLNYVRKAKLLTTKPIPTTDIPTTNIRWVGNVTVANFKVLPDLGGLIDTMIKSNKEGTSESPAGGPETPSASDTAKMFSDCYVTEKILDDGMGTDGGFTVVGMLDKLNPLFYTEQSRLPNTSTPSYTFEDGDGVRSVPVALRGSFGGTSGRGGASLSSELVWALYLVDARTRVFSQLLYKENERLGKGVSKSDLPNLFGALYLPSTSINPFYYRFDANHLDLSLINPATGAVPTEVGVVSATKGMRDEHLRVNFIGAPIDLNADYSFAIMMLNDAPMDGSLVVKGARVIFGSNNPTTSVTLEGSKATVSVNMYDAKTIKDPLGVGAIKRSIGLMTEPTNKEQLYSQVDKAIEGMNEQGIESMSTSSIFIPVVIRGWDNAKFMVQHCVPGYPFTLMDIASMSPVMFTGNLPATKSKKTKEDQHYRGQAVDITLTPFYAKTGIYLKPGTPHPFDTVMKNPLLSSLVGVPRYLISDGRTFQFGDVTYRSGQTFYDTNLSDNIAREEGSGDAVNQVFDLVLSGKTGTGWPSSSEFVGRLHGHDKVWHHVSMTKNAGIQAKPKPKPRPRAELDTIQGVA